MDEYGERQDFAMDKLSVFDLDGTLIAYDSYRAYLKRFLNTGWRGRMRLGFGYFSRKVGIVDAAQLKETIMRLARETAAYEEVLGDFARSVAADVSGRAFEMLQERKKAGDLVLILSASPDDYLFLLGETFGCLAKGSHFGPDGRFVHLHGASKLAWLRKTYPEDRYKYVMGVSDSPSDLQLLHAFEEGWLVGRGDLIQKIPPVAGCSLAPRHQLERKVSDA
jgi:phosphoserine phosphatase